jgi:hypothetical protein
MIYLHDCGAIVGDGLPAILIDHEQITAIWSQGSLDRGLYSKAGVDV